MSDWLPPLIAAYRHDPSGLQWAVAERVHADLRETVPVIRWQRTLAGENPSLRDHAMHKAAELIRQHGEAL